MLQTFPLISRLIDQQLKYIGIVYTSSDVRPLFINNKGQRMMLRRTVWKLSNVFRVYSVSYHLHKHYFPSNSRFMKLYEH